jgi:tRNA wybutosine-synthesizing protein 2
MLSDILPHMKHGGTIHVHSINPVCEDMSDALRDAGFDSEISVHRVKKYAPFRWHVVQDVILL